MGSVSGVDPVSCGRLLIRLLVLGSIQLALAAAKVDRRRCTTPHYVGLECEVPSREKLTGCALSDIRLAVQ